MNKGKVSNWNNITVFIPEELGASAISSVFFGGMFRNPT